MGTSVKKSITLERDLYEEVKPYAGRNFSAVVEEALRDWVLFRHANEVAREVEEEFGPVPEEIQRQARERWPS